MFKPVEKKIKIPAREHNKLNKIIKEVKKENRFKDARKEKMNEIIRENTFKQQIWVIKVKEECKQQIQE